MAKRESYVTDQKVMTYEAQIQVLDLAGGRPLSASILDKWLQILVDKGKLDPAEKEEIKAEETQKSNVDEETEGRTRGFKEKAGIPYIENRQVKAMFKESFVTLGYLNLMSPIERHHFQTALVIRPREILLPARDLEITTEENPCHVDTMKGPRSSIKRTIIAHNVQLSFLIDVLAGGNPKAVSYDRDMLETALIHASRFVGLGADRSQAFGTFKVCDFDLKEETHLNEKIGRSS